MWAKLLLREGIHLCSDHLIFCCYLRRKQNKPPKHPQIPNYCPLSWERGDSHAVVIFQLVRCGAVTGVPAKGQPLSQSTVLFVLVTRAHSWRSGTGLLRQLGVGGFSRPCPELPHLRICRHCDRELYQSKTLLFWTLKIKILAFHILGCILNFIIYLDIWYYYVIIHTLHGCHCAHVRLI